LAILGVAYKFVEEIDSALCDIDQLKCSRPRGKNPQFQKREAPINKFVLLFSAESN